MWGGFIRDKRGIEGLPMRLVIIVVVAAAVLAAIFLMFPKHGVSGPLQVSFDNVVGVNNVSTELSQGNVVVVKTDGEQTVRDIDFKIDVKVMDDGGKPISKATVTITGAGGVGVGVTEKDGTITIEVKNAKLEENQDTAYLSVRVKASGYPTYVDNEGIIIQRVLSS